MLGVDSFLTSFITSMPESTEVINMDSADVATEESLFPKSEILSILGNAESLECLLAKLQS